MMSFPATSSERGSPGGLLEGVPRRSSADSASRSEEANPPTELPEGTALLRQANRINCVEKHFPFKVRFVMYVRDVFLVTISLHHALS